MTKKKKKKNKEKQLRELKESFLVLCGTTSYHVDEDSERMKLISALREVRRLAEDDYENIETALSHLRLSCSEFIDYLEIEGNEVLEILKEIQENEPSKGNMTLLCIYESYKIQAAFEEDTVLEIIDHMDEFYSKPKNDSQYKYWIESLAKRNTFEGMPVSKFLDIDEDEDFPQLSCEKDIEHIFPYETVSNIDSKTICPEKKKMAPEAVLEAVEDFLSEHQNYSTSFLIYGSAGNGKTFLCNKIESKISEDSVVRILRPKIPIDFMGARVGDAENALTLMFSNIYYSLEKTILLMDDIDKLIQCDSNDSPHAYRMKLALISCLDQSRRCRDFLLICTSSTPLDDLSSRFDKTFELQNPNYEQRVAMIETSLFSQKVMDEEVKTIIDSIGRCTVGRSRAELVKYFRQAITLNANKCIDHNSTTGELFLLKSIQERVTNLTPESLRSGYVDGFVDMRVLSRAELIPHDNKDLLRLPLLGEGMQKAWQQLEYLVVTQLCQSKALDQILDCNRQASRRLFCGGALLTGCSGSGKTTLAYHAARIATTLLPTVKLVDVSCTSLVHKEVGGSEKALKRLFTAIRAAAPCIVLMDGIENIARVRGNDMTTYGTMDRLLSTLLTELDGIDTSIVANNKEEQAKFALIGVSLRDSWIDPALKRPGRLDKTIKLQKPNLQVRRVIAQQNLQELEKLSELSGEVIDISSVALDIAEKTENQTAADVIALCDEIRAKKAKEAMHNSLP